MVFLRQFCDYFRHAFGINHTSETAVQPKPMLGALLTCPITHCLSDNKNLFFGHFHSGCLIVTWLLKRSFCIGIYVKHFETWSRFKTGRDASKSNVSQKDSPNQFSQRAQAHPYLITQHFAIYCSVMCFVACTFFSLLISLRELVACGGLSWGQAW